MVVVRGVTLGAGVDPLLVLAAALGLPGAPVGITVAATTWGRARRVEMVGGSARRLAVVALWMGPAAVAVDGLIVAAIVAAARALGVQERRGMPRDSPRATRGPREALILSQTRSLRKG